MKGILLAGGLGSRLYPCTKVTNKHLLPVYNKPMILYPLQKMLNAGVKDILIVTGPEYSGHFLNLLGSGRDYNAKFSFEIQDKPGGIAEALGLARNFVKDDKMIVILGDNIFEDEFVEDVIGFENGESGAKIFLKEVPDANRFGVALLDSNGDNKVIEIEEKPKNPKTNYAVTGCYMYDNNVFKTIENLKPSHRNELEITDVNNAYIKSGKMKARILRGFWSDAGTFDSLMRASIYVHGKEAQKNKKTED